MIAADFIITAGGKVTALNVAHQIYTIEDLYMYIGTRPCEFTTEGFEYAMELIERYDWAIRKYARFYDGFTIIAYVNRKLEDEWQTYRIARGLEDAEQIRDQITEEIL